MVTGSAVPGRRTLLRHDLALAVGGEWTKAGVFRYGLPGGARPHCLRAAEEDEMAKPSRFASDDREKVFRSANVDADVFLRAARFGQASRVDHGLLAVYQAGKSGG